MTDHGRTPAPEDDEPDSAPSERNTRRARVLIPAGILLIAGLLILFMVLVSQLGR
ncbi:hypothetical protein [Blastococcus sp. LR1]|uniref:hypothetical protein n=1 Tax=Blastococcus sp. LR1 TaxID=2877000 RepID=UPI001CCA5289|nr:hypothetical protein [Blastococcus sp. LR1]MCA0146794.1 hypothetical protein [Blastococcus sp. LR1]